MCVLVSVCVHVRPYVYLCVRVGGLWCMYARACVCLCVCVCVGISVWCVSVCVSE